MKKIKTLVMGIALMAIMMSFAPQTSSAQTSEFNFSETTNGYYTSIWNHGCKIFADGTVRIWGCFLSDYGFYGYVLIKLYDSDYNYLDCIYVKCGMDQTNGVIKCFDQKYYISGSGKYAGGVTYASFSLSYELP